MLLGWKSAVGRIGEISLIGFSGTLYGYGQVLGASAHEGYNAPVLASVAGEFQQKETKIMDVMSTPRASQK